MPSHRRVLIVVGLLGLAYAVLLAFGRWHAPAAARWPVDDSFFELPGWSVSPATSIRGDGDIETGGFIQRTYYHLMPPGERAEFVLWTTSQPQAKLLYRKGPDRDFLGAGYITEPAPVGLVSPIAGGGALIARQGRQSWLLLYTFGERRGRLGSDAFAWSAAEWDALLDQPNHYFLARISVPFNSDQLPPVQVATEIAQPLFARLGEWYSEMPRPTSATVALTNG